MTPPLVVAPISNYPDLDIPPIDTGRLGQVGVDLTEFALAVARSSRVMLRDMLQDGCYAVLWN